MLDVKRMVILRDLAEHARVTAVADLHGVTPSAVSQQLRALEAEAGAALVERDGRGLRLTPPARHWPPRANRCSPPWSGPRARCAPSTPS